MRRLAVPLALLGLFLVGFSGILHKGKLSRAQSDGQASSASAVPAATPHEVDFAYYSLGEGFSSTLFLVSDSPQAIDLTVAVHGRRGETVATQTSIQPQQKLPLDLRRLLVRLGGDVDGAFAEGSVAVSYMASGPRAVVGQLTITNPALSLVHESEMVENDPAGSDIPPVLDSLWWGLAGGRDARLMVANMSANLVIADVFLDFQGDRHPSAALTFNPHETKILSIAQLLGDLNASVSQAPEGGITIIQRGPNPSLIAQGKVTDPVTGFSTTLEFPDPARRP